MTKLSPPFAVAALIAVFGCSSSSGGGNDAASGGSAGSGGGGPNCEFTPCGGSMLGTWNVETACVIFSSDPMLQYCESASSSVTLSVSGSVTYSDDGTWLGSGMVVGTQTIVLPAICLGSDAATCSALEGQIKQLPQYAPNYKSVNCSGDPSTSCTCILGLIGIDPTGSGKFTTSGTVLTTTETIDGGDSPPANVGYCVQGRVLTTNSVQNGVQMISTFLKQ